MKASGKIIKIIIGLGLIANITTAVAKPKQVVQIGRYLVMSARPTASQQNPLNQIIQVRFPKKVNTINQAVRYLLNYSGYKLAAVKQQSKIVREMLCLPLPLVWMSVMTWAGFKVGGFIGGVVNPMSEPASGAGNEAGRVGESTIRKIR